MRRQHSPEKSLSLSHEQLGFYKLVRLTPKLLTLHRCQFSGSLGNPMELKDICRRNEEEEDKDQISYENLGKTELQFNAAKQKERKKPFEVHRDAMLMGDG